MGSSLLAALMFAPLAHAAEDWPWFQGLRMDGTSAETGLLRSFPPEGPAVHWTVETGAGFGGASVRDGEVYLLDRVAGETDVLRVLDAQTGDELWRFEHEVDGRLMFPGSRCVPTVGEEFVYAVGGFGHVYCIDRESHDAVWIVDLQEEYDGELPMFGYATQPLILEDLLIVTPMSEEYGVVALDRFTGDEMWHAPGVGSSHSTPVLLELLGEQHIVYLSSRIDMEVFNNAPGGRGGRPGAPGQRPPGTAAPDELPDTAVPDDMADFVVPGNGILSAYNFDGDLAWQSDAFYCSTAIPAPIRIDDEHLFLTGGYKAGSALMKLVERADGVQLEEVFRTEQGSQIHIPVRVGDYLYLLVNENANDPRPRRRHGGLMCVDLQGNEMWRTGDDPYFGRGNMILADGMLVIQDGYSGILRLIEPTPSEYKPIAEANIFGIETRRDQQMWAPMALSDGRLYMRSQTELKSVGLAAAGN